MQDPLISVDELAGRMGAPDIRLVDATWELGSGTLEARQRYLEGRIPGAVFFDIDEIADRETSLPHMLPRAEVFSSRVRRMGIGDGADIIVYDQNGIFSAARVWWTFRVMGAREVRVLDGGLPAWRAAGLPLEDGPPPAPGERHFTVRIRQDLVRSLEHMRRLVDTGRGQILDARPAGRFSGAAPEPRAGLRRGHMPGALNLPHAEVLTPDGRMLPKAELEKVFEQRGVSLRRPTVTTCGSGVSASVLALALARLGVQDAAVYDGSWAEWGAALDTPIVVDG